MQEKFNVLVLFNKSASLKVLLNIQKTECDTLRESLWELPFKFLLKSPWKMRTENRILIYGALQ